MKVVTNCAIDPSKEQGKVIEQKKGEIKKIKNKNGQ